MRFFNTAGPVRPDKHYAIQPLNRVDDRRAPGLIRGGTLFCIARAAPDRQDFCADRPARPAQRGEAGNFRCVDVNVEPAQVARDDVARGIRAILGSLAENAQELGDDYPGSVWQDVLASMGPESALNVLLARWCRADPTPLVLLVDEIDSLVGDTLLSVLRQLRTGYRGAPRAFRRAWCCAGCATSATTASGRAPGRSSPAAARSTSPRSPCAWVTSPRPRRGR